MHAGEDPNTDQNQNRQKHQGQNNQANAASEESLLDLAAVMIALARQTWKDRFTLAKAEARLAFSTILLLIGLAFLMAMTVTLIWVLILVGAGYYAFQSGVPLGWVLVAAILAQVLVVFYLRWQIRSIRGWLTFPATRRAFSRSLFAEMKKAPTESGETPQ